MGSPTEVIAADVRAPSGTGAPTQNQRLANTGTTESKNATALTVGEYATYKNGATPVRISFAATNGGVAVAVTDMIIGPYESWPWLVCQLDQFVGVEAADATSAYEGWV